MEERGEIEYIGDCKGPSSPGVLDKNAPNVNCLMHFRSSPAHLTILCITLIIFGVALSTLLLSQSMLVWKYLTFPRVAFDNATIVLPPADLCTFTGHITVLTINCLPLLSHLQEKHILSLVSCFENGQTKR